MTARPVMVVLFLAACAALVVPLWIWNVQTQDGPAHLYNAMLLKNFYAADSVTLRGHFSPAFDALSNWSVDLMMVLLLHVFSAFTCNSIVLSMCTLLLPLSVAYLMRAAGKGRSPFVIAALIFAYNWTLFMGFYNFTLGVALYCFALGYWLGRRDRMTPRRWVMLSLATCLIFVTHVFVLAAFFLSLALGMLLLCRDSYLRRPPAEVVRFFAPLLLPALLLALYEVRQPPLQLMFRKLDLLYLLRDVQPLVYYVRGEHIAAGAFWAALAAGAVLSVRARMARGLRPEPADYFAVLSTCFFVLALIAPAYAVDARWHAGFMNERFLLFAFLSALPWFEESYPGRWARRSLCALLLAILTLHSVATWAVFRRTEPELKVLMSESGRIPPHSTFSYHTTHPAGSNAVVVPLDKVLFFYCIGPRDVAMLSGRPNTFPHHFKRLPVEFRPEYFAVYKSADEKMGYLEDGKFVPQDFERNYELVRKNGKLEFYRRRSDART